MRTKAVKMLMTSLKDRLGLALSGGGYRAAAFHLGTLNKLHELGILNKVDVISTISGGSITGAAWCLYNGDYPSFHKEMVTKLTTKSVIWFILGSWIFLRTLLFILLFIGGAIALSFTSLAYLTFPVLLLFKVLLYFFQFRIFPVSKVIEKAYNKYFCDGKTLGQLKERPLLAIGSSNLHSGRPFTFSRNKMGDSSYTFRQEYNPPIKFLHQNFPVARAVVASSCVPFAFTPVTINKEFFEVATDVNRVKPVLVDGGVYDNQGIQKLTQPKSSYECGIIITSDAGGNFIADEKYPNTLQLLLRTVNLFMYRIKAAQMVQNIYRNVQGGAKPIAYFSLGWRIQNAIPGFFRNMCDGQVIKEVVDAHCFQPDWINNPKNYEKEIIQHLEAQVGYAAIAKRDLTDEQWDIARRTGTNLTALPQERLSYLVRHAENFTELQVKLYCPSLI
jgi:NTE family protein